jgi:uncharacterized protein YdeI (YjbR/CyaY-like superfamily)
MEASQRGEVWIGGCIVFGDDPDSYCKDCSHMFKKDQRPKKWHYFSDPNKFLRAATRAEWRRWLSENFDKENEVWLVIPKLSSGKDRIPYNDTVEEALCFGWIDSTGKRMDDEYTLQRFTPRRKGSPYSQPNIERLRWLPEKGLLHPSVEEQVKDLLDEEFEYPEDIIDELKKDPLVWKNYQAFSEPYKRIRVAYVDGARDRPDEFGKRLANFIEKTRLNKKFGYGGIEKYY